MRVRSGVEGFDALVGGGFLAGSSVILQGPPGNEKDEFALRFVAEGLRLGEAVIALVSSTSPEQFLESLTRSGADVPAALSENRLRIVDWYSRQRENVAGVEERGPILRCSVDLTDVGIGVSRAIAGLAPRVARRGLVEILSPSLRIHNSSQVYEFAQNVKAKLAHNKVTGLFLLERDMHEQEVVSTVCQPFDGVVDIIREQDADTVRRRIVVLWLKDTVPDPRVHNLEMVSGKGPSVVLPGPQESRQTEAPPPHPDPATAADRSGEAPRAAAPSVRPAERTPVGKSAGKRTPEKESDLAPDRCPNCKGPLAFEERETEGFCGTCAIFVEILKDAPEPPAQELRNLVRAEIQIAKRHELEVLCRESGLKLSGSRADLVERLLHYLDRGAPGDRSGDSGRSPTEVAGAALGPESAMGRRELVLFLLSLGASRKTAGAVAKFFGTYARFLEGDPADIALFSGLPKEHADRLRAVMKPRPAPPPRPMPVAQESKREIPPPPPGEPEIATTFVRASKPLERPEALRASAPRPAPEVDAPSPERLQGKTHDAPAGARRRWGKRPTFYAGILLVSVGGSGLLLGSFFHDILRVPVIGDRYEAFGWLNAAAALTGSLVVALGLGSIRRALRGPRVRARPARGG